MTVTDILSAGNSAEQPYVCTGASDSTHAAVFRNPRSPFLCGGVCQSARPTLTLKMF